MDITMQKCYRSRSKLFFEKKIDIDTKDKDITVILVKEGKKSIAIMSANYVTSCKKLKLGVTGTNEDNFCLFAKINIRKSR